MVGKRVRVFLLNHRLTAGVLVSFDDFGLVLRDTKGQCSLVSRAGIEGVSLWLERSPSINTPPAAPPGV